MQAGDPVSSEVHRVAPILEVIAKIGCDVAVVFDYENTHWDL
jgi:hypothetical protein